MDIARDWPLVFKSITDWFLGFRALSVGTAGGIVQYHAGGTQQCRILKLRYHDLGLLRRDESALADHLTNWILIMHRQDTRQDHQRRVDHVQDVHDAQTQGSPRC